MTIMELGALGEFVGAFAVVATLSIARKSSTKSLSSPVKRTMLQGSTRPSTRMYLSGIAAFDVVQWFGGGFLDVSAIVGGAGAVSALKMC